MQASSLAAVPISHDSLPEKPAQRWTVEAVMALYDLPFMDLIWRAQEVHRRNFDANAIQRSTLLSVKTGGCSEDCKYCSQSARHKDAPVERERLLQVDEVVAAAKLAKEKGASRFCMGAAWRGPKDGDLDKVVEMVSSVKALGMETCLTLGILGDGQAEKLKTAGLDYYNHNIDTAAEFYGQVITTHTYKDRINTLDKVREAGLKICCGGIIGMGETRKHRAALIAQLASMEKAPDSVPINHLVAIPGTPMAEQAPLDPFEFVRTIAAARITMPASWVRLSAGRSQMNDELQALCFLAGANSLFYGDQLLTTGNPDVDKDDALFQRLGLKGI